MSLRNRFFIFFLIFIIYFNQLCYGQASLKETVTFLSSANLGGRCPGTKSDSIVQKYIYDNFKINGLIPAPGLTNFYQSFNFLKSYNYSGHLLFIKGKDSKIYFSGNDFYFGAQSKEDSLSLELAFIGYGITNQTISDQPFDNTLKDKAVIAYLSLPPFLPDSIKEWIQLNKRNSISELIKAGAKAVLYILPKDYRISGNEFHGAQNKDNGILTALISNQLGEIFAGKEILQNYNTVLHRKENFDVLLLKDRFISISCRKQINVSKTANIIGLKKGTHEKYIIIGAHHDHLCPRSKNDSIFPGANDNASGVAILLALCSYFQEYQTKYNILFTAFAAEERGLLGSKYFLNNTPIERKNIAAMINLDMVGGMLNDTLYYEMKNLKPRKSLLYKVNPDKLGLILQEKALGVSDSYMFGINSVPTIYLSTGYSPTLHTIHDTEDKINYTGMNKIYSYLHQLVKIINEMDLD